MSDHLLDLFVIGRPAPQGSKRFLGAGRPPIESSRYVKPWRADIRDAAIAHYRGDVLDEALSVYLLFYLPRPKSTPKITPRATKRPDLDKLVRAVFDALSSAGVWADDARVVELSASKVITPLGQPTGARIIVRPCLTPSLGEDRA